MAAWAPRNALRRSPGSSRDPSSSGGWPQLFSAIKADAPNAEVVVLGYPHLFVGSTPTSAGRCLRDGWILDSDQDWLNSVADQIDGALQTAATNAGFDYISTSAAFTGHELCSSSPLPLVHGHP